MEVYYNRKKHTYFEDFMTCGEILFATNRVAVGYTIHGDDIVFMKQGRPEDVEQWAEKHRKVYAKGGFPDMALAIRIVVFPEGYDLDKINRILSTSSYLGILLREEGIE